MAWGGESCGWAGWKAFKLVSVGVGRGEVVEGRVVGGRVRRSTVCGCECVGEVGKVGY